MAASYHECPYRWPSRSPALSVAVSSHWLLTSVARGKGVAVAERVLGIEPVVVVVLVAGIVLRLSATSIAIAVVPIVAPSVGHGLIGPRSILECKRACLFHVHFQTGMVCYMTKSTFSSTVVVLTCNKNKSKYALRSRFSPFQNIVCISALDSVSH